MCTVLRTTDHAPLTLIDQHSRDRGRHEHKDKVAGGGDARRDGQRHERKPREHSEGGRAEGAPRGGHSQQHRQNQQQQQLQQPPQQQQQQQAAPKSEAASQPQAAEGGRNELADRGERGERRCRRGRRRRGGRGRGEGAQESGAPNAEPRAEGGGDNAREFQPQAEKRQEAQHSLDLAAPRPEQAAEPAPPKPERSEPAGDSGHADPKFTVWSSGPSPSGSSWGGGGSSRREE